MPDAADRGRLYAVELEFLNPRVLLVPYGSVLFEQHTVDRHVNSAYRRLLAEVFLRVLRSVFVSKTYRHLRLGGITSRAGRIGQQHYVPVAEHLHVFDGVVIEAYHFGFTALSALELYEMQLIAVFFDEFYDVARINVYSRGVVAWMYAHEFVLKVLVDEYHDVLFLVGEQAERGYRAADEAHLFHEVFFRRECERTGVVGLAELLEINLLVFEAGDEIVFALFVIAYKEVFRYLPGMRQTALEHLVYGVDGFVLNYLILYFAVIEQLYDVFLCKCHLSFPFRQEQAASVIFCL